MAELEVRYKVTFEFDEGTENTCLWSFYRTNGEDYEIIPRVHGYNFKETVDLKKDYINDCLYEIMSIAQGTRDEILSIEPGEEVDKGEILKRAIRMTQIQLETADNRSRLHMKECMIALRSITEI
jgi:hypothetical protein